MSRTTDWYWDLQREKAVPADERGPGDQTMGPYPTREAAENWKATLEERNEEWDRDDEEWEHAGESDEE